MNRTLRLSFSLKNTYRVNSILYSIKQIPLLGRLFPETLYQSRELKILANVISVIWEILSVFLGKFLYMATMVAGLGALYQTADSDQVFLHILFFLTIAGTFMNTYLFNPTRDKYYAMMLMRMDAREYTLVNYTYAIGKVILGFLPFALWFGLGSGVSLWLCLLIPLFVAGGKITMAASCLRQYEKTGEATNENRLGKWGWLGMLALLGLAYGLPLAGLVLPPWGYGILMLLCAGLGAVSWRKVMNFQDYRDMYQQILASSMNQMDAVKKAAKSQSQKAISTDLGITSHKKGFEYLNELFIKRHQKILWKSSKRTAFICLCLVLMASLVLFLVPEAKEPINELLMVMLPYFVFIMYAINRGTGFTQALFMNCDHSLLTYSFYKQPAFVLRLFQIRLREIVKINLLPAAVIGGGLALLLYVSGGTDNPINYGILLVSILCLSVFFSVHYLVIYYLLQPYNAGTEIKSGTYRIVMYLTYLVCFFLMQLRMSTLVFGLMTIVFCVLYSIIASVLVYRFAPKTFRIRT